MVMRNGRLKRAAPFGRALCTGLAVLALGACVQAQPYRAEDAGAADEGARVVLMPPDVVVLELATAGVPLPRADWSADVEKALVTAVREKLQGSRAEMVRYRTTDEVVPYADSHRDMVALHQTVLQSILTYRYRGQGQGPELPTKGDKLDWTLGETVAPLRADYEADYALFLTYRQATATAGRALMAAATFVLFGAIQPTSQSLGLASLVDLSTGEVVWTNVIQGQALDVSKPSNVRSRGEKLLSELPL